MASSSNFQDENTPDDQVGDNTPAPKGKEKLLEVARKRYARAIEMENDNRAHALTCLKFRNLEQWDPEVKNFREKDPEGARPCLVVDKTNQYLNQVINDYRQNRPSIKVLPVDDKGDEEVAEVYNGIIRNIEYQSSADMAYDTAYEAAVDGGFGYFRIVTEYCDEMSFEQDIRILPIKNRFQVVLDPNREYPHRPPKWGFVVEKMLRDDFKREYPDANQLDFASDDKTFSEWAFKDYIVVAEYFFVEPKRVKICQYADGSVVEKGSPEELQYAGIPKIAERETTINVVKWKKITAMDVLDERDWPGKFIPIIEVTGTELDIEGKSIKSGLLKGAMQPQQIHNYAVSSYVETVMLAPRAPWVGAAGQIESFEELYRTANRRSITFLPYKPVVDEGNHPVPAPKRTEPAGISPGWINMVQMSEHDISASMGMYAETVLGTGDAQSGKQELLQQKRGDTATFHYADNASRAIRFCGQQLIDLIPKIYDTERIVRILGEDGASDQAALNPMQPEAVKKITTQDGAIKRIYNLNTGKYDVAVSVGPSFMTKRLEASTFLAQAMQAAKDPVTSQILGYLSIKNSDWAGAEEGAAMIKKTLPPGIAESDDEQPMVQTQKGPIPAEQAGQMIAQQEQALMQATEAVQKADADKQQAEVMKQQNDAERTRLEGEKVNVEKFRAETERMKVEAEAMARDAENLAHEATEDKGNAEAAAATATAVASQQLAEAAAALAQMVPALMQTHKAERHTQLVWDENGRPSVGITRLVPPEPQVMQ